jgi:ParB family chromosome partitioning protein
MADSKSDRTARPARKKPRLGRGLSSLIVNSATTPDDGQYAADDAAPAAARPATPAEQPREIQLDQIAPNPYQPRQQFSDEHIAELAQSIRAQGVLQPLLVAPLAEPDGDRAFAVVAGERRLRAARKAELETVPCVVRQATPEQMLEWAMIENIQREDLNPVEQARAYRDYMDRFGLTQAHVAERLGQPRATVANYLRLLDLSDAVQQLLLADELTFGHAKVLAGLAGQPAKQLALAKKTARNSLSVRQLEGLIASTRPDAPPARTGRSKADKPAYIRDLQDQLTRHVGTKVTITPGRAKDTGRLIIDYYSLDDFDRIVSSLGANIDS